MSQDDVLFGYRLRVLDYASRSNAPCERAGGRSYSSTSPTTLGPARQATEPCCYASSSIRVRRGRS
jgi:hypothetical protein